MPSIDPAQLLLQLGAIGAVLFVVWKIGSKWLDRQRETEKERTEAIAEGFKQITTSVNTHSFADIASHDRLAAAHNDLRAAVVRVEGKIDAALDWQERTPVEGTRIPQRMQERRDTPRAGSQYGPRPGTKER